MLSDAEKIYYYEAGLSDLANCSEPTIRAKILQAAARYGIDGQIALRQINQESGCRASVCSSAGACGIAQFIPSTWAAYGSGDRSNVDNSLEAWGKYMRHLLDHFGGDYRLALAGYHSGEGSARAALANPKGNPKTNHYVNTIMGGGANPSPLPSPGPGAAPDFNGFIEQIKPYAPYLLFGLVALSVIRR